MNDLQTRIGREPQVCYTQIADDEIVILNPADDNFYHLNETAVDLWLSLESPKTVDELSRALADKYTGVPEDYQHDVLEWVQDTAQKGLLVRMDARDVTAYT